MVEKTHSAGWWPQIYDPLRNLSGRIADWFAPRSDASAAADSYEICLELPGVKSEDVDISVHNNELTIKGEKRIERQEKGRSYFFSEREYGAFQRSFRLPADAKAEDVSADYTDGILTVKVPKAGPPPKKTQRVKIKAG